MQTDSTLKVNKRRMTIGILAHADAGKTTLAEGILYTTGTIRKYGRIDHRDTFLDNFSLERERGITIFSKQAQFAYNDMPFTLLDTPGHVDFTSETERVLSVLDMAVLVISGSEGVQSHVRTLFSLLTRYKVPAFVFVNKMDIAAKSEKEIMKDLERELSENCLRFSEKGNEEFYEHAALCGERLMNIYEENDGMIPDAEIKEAIKRREIIPCFFGSALKLSGIEELLNGLSGFASHKEYENGEEIKEASFAARIFKITRDKTGTRLTHLRILRGSLKTKDRISEDEKVEGIRLYNGEKYESVGEVAEGDVCTVTGPVSTFAGQGINTVDAAPPQVTPVLMYKVSFPYGTRLDEAHKNLQILAEEDPELNIQFDEETGEITAMVMGEIQLEVIKTLVKERFQMDISFGNGKILYKETLVKPTVGVGHFEPLRHYAEVHLLMEPGETGSGLIFESNVSTDLLERNWQRLILTHLEEKVHRGVLTGSPLTDVKISLIAGRAHKKHTEGGDFRKATYRAVRQGLMMGESRLLEPYYRFILDIPAISAGRAMNDIKKMSGSFEIEEMGQENAVLTGRCPVSTMREYIKEVNAYTGGVGKLSLSNGGYDECHNPEEVIEEMGYNPEADTRNPVDSVFCAHGSGFVVPWDKVRDYMHISDEGRLISFDEEDENSSGGGQDERQEERPSSKRPAGTGGVGLTTLEDKELAAIFNKTYKSSKTENAYEPMSVVKHEEERKHVDVNIKEKTEEYLLVDGYNIIFSWEDLNELSKQNLAAARGKLADELANYCGFKRCKLILVFDAYKVEGARESVSEYSGIYIVYTKEAETADRYIERTVHSIAKDHKVTVATSDATEQVIIWAKGALRMSARELKDEVEYTKKEIREIIETGDNIGRVKLLSGLPKETAEFIEEIRLGKRVL
ncbi:MAG: TetM/TetW/TetO/TetS family tetracycline resistance ribosomal protection protein [Lachnospiraceae bacterium]|nr:TetM/TetW/TetO/TetS family tetracycline resistance ribosomal protection protein [Lachnospiraceae bacterium]